MSARGMRMSINPAGRYAYRVRAGLIQLRADAETPRVVVRCDACGNVFEDVLGDMAPCPHCQRIARGAA